VLEDYRYDCTTPCFVSTCAYRLTWSQAVLSQLSHLNNSCITFGACIYRPQSPSDEIDIKYFLSFFMFWYNLINISFWKWIYLFHFANQLPNIVQEICCSAKKSNIFSQSNKKKFTFLILSIPLFQNWILKRKQNMPLDLDFVTIQNNRRNIHTLYLTLPIQRVFYKKRKKRNILGIFIISAWPDELSVVQI